jgi:rRNA maturation endonuclease Nob1
MMQLHNTLNYGIKGKTTIYNTAGSYGGSPIFRCQNCGEISAFFVTNKYCPSCGLKIIKKDNT